MGDRLTVDYVGRIDGAEFDGGRAEGAELVLGEGQLIPGLVEGLVGVKAGEERVVAAKFPEAYGAKELAGKDADFTVTVTEVAKSVLPEADEEFAKTLGAQSLAELKDMLRARIAAEYGGVTYAKLKRQVMDALDKAHDFALPEALVASEFNAIWSRVGAAPQAEDGTEPAKPEDERKADVRRIAERRVRLGLLIGDIGEKQKIEVSEDELKRALIARARNFPGQERAVYEYYQKNPSAVMELKGPIFEDKVIGHVIEQARPADKKVSVEELYKPAEDDAAWIDAAAQHADDHGHDHGHDHDHHDHDHGHHDHGHDHHGHDHEHHDHGHQHHDDGGKS
jgi:trigger factor